MVLKKDLKNYKNQTFIYGNNIMYKTHPLYNEFYNIANEIGIPSAYQDEYFKLKDEGAVQYVDVIIVVATFVVKLLIENCQTKAERFSNPNTLYRWILWRYIKKATSDKLENPDRNFKENVQYDVYELLINRASKGITQSVIDNQLNRIKLYDSRNARSQDTRKNQ